MIGSIKVFVMKELLFSYQKSARGLLQVFLFLSIFLLLLVLTQDGTSERIYSYGWCVLTLMALVSGNSHLEKNIWNGQIETLFLLGHAVYTIAFTHLLLYWVTQLLPLVVLLTALGHFMGVSYIPYAELTLGSLSLAALATLSSSLTQTRTSKALMGPLLMIPLGVPLFVILGLQQQAFEMQPFTLLLGAYCLLIVPLCSIASATALKHEMAAH